MDDSDKIIHRGAGIVPGMKHHTPAKRRWFDVLLQRLPERGIKRSELIRKVTARLQVADSTVYAWLNGGREVSPEELKIIAEEAGFTVSELLQEDVYYLRDKAERELMDAFRSMGETERSLVLRMIAGKESQQNDNKKKPD